MIDNKCNPSTPEEWDRCMRDIAKAGQAKLIGSTTDEDGDAIKKELLDSGVEELGDKKDNNDEHS
jgi:hypothetical protein